MVWGSCSGSSQAYLNQTASLQLNCHTRTSAVPRISLTGWRNLGDQSKYVWFAPRSKVQVTSHNFFPIWLKFSCSDQNSQISILPYFCADNSLKIWASLSKVTLKFLFLREIWDQHTPKCFFINISLEELQGIFHFGQLPKLLLIKGQIKILLQGQTLH